MSLLQDEQEVLDEGVPPIGHPSTTQQPISDEEKEGSSSVASCHRGPKVNAQDEKTGSLPDTEGLRHPSAKSTSNGTIAEEKSNESTQAPSKQLSSGPENETSTVEVFNRVPLIPPEAPIPSEKTGQQEEADEDKYPEGGLRAWLVVLGAFSGMTASFGNLNSTGTFQAYVSTHQLAHESPGAIGWIFSLYAFLTFFCGVQIGPIFDAYGPRWLVFAGTVCLFGGMMGVAESTSECCLLPSILPWLLCWWYSGLNSVRRIDLRSEMFPILSPGADTCCCWSCAGGIQVILDSIRNGADLMVEWSSMVLLSTSYLIHWLTSSPL